MTNEKLLPCPFCGGEARLDFDADGTGMCRVACQACDTEGPSVHISSCMKEEYARDEAVELWNTRFSTPPGDDEVERLIQRASGYISLATRLGNRTDSDHNHIVIMEELVAAITAIPSRGEGD